MLYGREKTASVQIWETTKRLIGVESGGTWPCSSAWSESCWLSTVCRLRWDLWRYLNIQTGGGGGFLLTAEAERSREEDGGSNPPDQISVCFWNLPVLSRWMCEGDPGSALH